MPDTSNRWTRLLRHRWHDDAEARRLLDDAALDRLQQRIEASERRHSGEIRLCIEAALPLAELWRGTAARERALALFGQLGVWDTEFNNGVLIYLLLAEHAIEIVADRGVDRLVPAGHWAAVTQHMAAAFRDGRFEAGLMAAIEAVEATLLQQFPLAAGAGDANELADRPLRL
ncbi:TPM domain-containing protein [Aquabacterium humicola]|uniref:TPM domain-containing protein n=1 Tax=Aquabacterium humicola TaxID=3237377 RepID=UPI002542A5C6|nr:TPM domain-containing protein [Rubrivivax pictus]